MSDLEVEAAGLTSHSTREEKRREGERALDKQHKGNRKEAAAAATVYDARSIDGSSSSWNPFKNG